MIKHYNSFKLCTLSVIEMMCYDKYNFFFCNYTTWFTRFFFDIKKWSLENYQRKISQNSLANHHHYVLTDINFIFSYNDAEISHNLCNVVSSHRQQKKVENSSRWFIHSILLSQLGCELMWKINNFYTLRIINIHPCVGTKVFS